MFSKFIWILAEKHLMVFGAKIHSHVYGFASMACHGTKIIFLARKEKKKLLRPTIFSACLTFTKLLLQRLKRKLGFLYDILQSS